MKAFRTAFCVWLVVMVFTMGGYVFPAYSGAFTFSGIVFCFVWFLAWAEGDHDEHSNYE